MSTFFTSDTHFGHANIIKHCNRPFKDSEEMDTEMIRIWNATVSPGDCVYHLGDFCFRGRPAEYYLSKLNGNIKFVWGNHDQALKGRKDLDIEHLREIKIEGQSIVLCHYAMKVWNKSHHGAWHLYGHSHGSLPEDNNSLSFDVGVDCWGYTPLSFHMVESVMKRKTFVPIDHHR